MFTTKITSAIVAGTLALGVFAASSNTASAHDSGSIYFGGPNFSIGFSKNGHGHRHVHHRDWDRPHFRGKRCTARKALRKARRKGIRRAYIKRIGRKGIVVAGRKWGDRIVMGFGKQRNCPVRFARMN